MHSRIFEITSEQLGRDDYLTSSWLDPEQYSDFADYVSDYDVDEEGSIEWFGTCMSDIFDCDGREVTLRDISGFLELWKADVRDKASKFDPIDGMSSYDLRKSLEKTHEDIEFHFYAENYGMMNAGQLIKNVLLHRKPGDKFYIGGILDYHF